MIALALDIDKADAITTDLLVGGVAVVLASPSSPQVRLVATDPEALRRVSRELAFAADRLARDKETQP